MSCDPPSEKIVFIIELYFLQMLYEAAFLFNNNIYIIEYHTQDEEILFELISDILE